MSVLCLAGAGATARLAVAAFSLAWSHSIEHTRWEEHWQVGPRTLRLETARVEGSGAGMDPAPEAHLVGNAWTWHPGLELSELILRRAGEAGDWQICTEGSGCRSIAALLPPGADPVRLWPCE